MSETMTTRRSFLKSCVGTTAVVGVAATCSSCAWFQKRDVQVEAPADATEVALSFDQHPGLKEPDGFVRIEARDGAVRLIVVRLPDGKLVALSMECTHWGCDVDWDRKHGWFDCSCHGSRFDVAGQVLEGPADEPLPVYPVAETEHGIVVSLAR